MALYDDPPHNLTLYKTTSTEDDGGGRQLVRELVQSNIAVSLNRSGASSPRYNDQGQMVVGGRIGVLSSLLDEYPQRGWVGTTVHTETGETQTVIFSGNNSGGVSIGEAYGGIPSLTYFGVDIIL